MISLETESRIAKIFLNLSQRENQVEINRQVLAQNLDFDVYQAFTFIDKEGKKGINCTNLVDFLRKNGVYLNHSEGHFIIFSYDEDSDNILSYSEFLNMVLPESNTSLRRVARERVGTVFTKENIPYNVEYAIVKLLESEIELARTTLTLINDAKLRYDFKINDIFHLITDYDSIRVENIKEFLSRNTVVFDNDDALAILKRIDINKDKKIDFFEFQMFFDFPLNLQGPGGKPCNYRNNINNANDNTDANEEQNVNDNILGEEDFSNSQMLQMGKSNDIKANSTNNFNMGKPNNNGKIRISSNLNLRKSPKRRFFPKKTITNNTISQMNKSNMTNLNMSMTEDNNMSLKLNLRRSPERKNAPITNNSQFNLSSSKNFTHSDPLCCIHCRSYPCKCCQFAYENGESLFLNYMKELIKIEQQIEKAKIELAMRSDFNVEDAYRIFEYNERASLTEDNLNYGLRQLNINANLRDIKLLMRRIDIRRSGRIEYADFFDFVTPFEKEYRSMVEIRLPSSFIPKFNKADIFSFSTKILLQNLIIIIINSENKLENMRLGMKDARAQLAKIYKEIDLNGNGFINYIDLANYFNRKGVSYNDIECEFAFIRLDVKRNGKVEFWEISDEITSII